ncbi:lipid scramblase CLPTM1L-like [Apostichopus japonicus]|uniref:lipid scramblase CLPTM1L-like n=1 Tax=Stichopus japonicus TaxID=307972 RepID=UPI003AB3D639
MMASFGSIINVVVIGCFCAYFLQVGFTMYEMFNPKQCDDKKNCLGPAISVEEQVMVRLYTAVKPGKRKQKDLDLLLEDTISIQDGKTWDFNVSLPKKTMENGTLHMTVMVTKVGESPWSGKGMSLKETSVTKYAPPREEEINLLRMTNETKSKRNESTPEAHWRPKIEFSLMSHNFVFDKTQIPREIFPHLRINDQNRYLPILFVNELIYRGKDLLPINTSAPVLPLHIEYKPISVGKLRLFTTLGESMKMMVNLGFTEKDTDEVLSIFLDINLYLLALTIVVSMFHMLFDFLAFKNDIHYWRNRKNMIGLSTRTVLWRAVSQMIIFLYLWDEKASLLVLVPCGIGTIIEMWKVKRAFKTEISFTGWRPVISFGSKLDSEKATDEFDSQAMRYLSYILYPLCIAGAVYSLLYVSYKSWYSWIIHCLVNGVYAFGFLLMMPQLFVNYKLKSVAHLPWRAFTYKAFNTFIDDMFAFIITMPTSHRLACFRDDFVFLIFLYQKWLYPVDKTRVNEYGVSYDDDDDDDEKEDKEHRD